jgi:hypothetical protein
MIVALSHMAASMKRVDGDMGSGYSHTASFSSCVKSPFS